MSELSDLFPIATRRSPLAMAQALMAQAKLVEASGLGLENFPILGLTSTGDKLLDRKLIEAGGKGLFTKEIDEAQLDGRAVFAVHSMKDVPTRLPDGLPIAAMFEREDPRDLLLTADGPSHLTDLPQGARLGTASLRRQAQALHKRPDLEIHTIRGNVDTRLSKLREGEVDATYLARAGLKRLGKPEAEGEPEPIDLMLPAVGQGAIGLAVREDNAAAMALAAKLDHGPTHQAVRAERGFLEALDGSCRTPIAAHAVQTEGGMRLTGEVLSPDGKQRRRGETDIPAGEDPAAAGRRLGEALRAEGAHELIADITA